MPRPDVVKGAGHLPDLFHCAWSGHGWRSMTRSDDGPSRYEGLILLPPAGGTTTRGRLDVRLLTRPVIHRMRPVATLREIVARIRNRDHRTVDVPATFEAEAPRRVGAVIAVRVRHGGIVAGDSLILDGDLDIDPADVVAS
jgi:hypothetical protein